MSNTDVAPGGGSDAIVSVPVSTPATPDTTPISAREAASQLSSWRDKRDKAGAEAPAGDTPAVEAPPPVEDLGLEPDVDPQEPADPGATTNEPDPATTPTIEPPRSWTKAEKEEFATYPREAQEKIARREQERDTAIRRSQNETAEARKAIDAERVQVDQARQRYEQALPALLQTLQEQQGGEFADIKTMSDVEKLAREDWPRYALWDAQQKKIAAVTNEVQAAQHRQAQEYETQWNNYATRQDQLLLDKVPELADKTKAPKLADMAASLYRAVGFEDAELANLWSGKTRISLRDSRLSQIVLDAARYREAKANAAANVAKPNLPPVQRPGVGASRTPDQHLQALEKAFEKSGSLKDAAALRLARQKAQR